MQWREKGRQKGRHKEGRVDSAVTEKDTEARGIQGLGDPDVIER